MLMTDYALNQGRKRNLRLKVWTVRVRSGISGKSRNSGKISGLSGLSAHQRKTETTQIFNLA
jgi:hypothetical protein